MKYILCEDKKSGAYFFQTIVNILDVNSECVIISSEGNKGYFKDLKNLFFEERIKSGDSLLLSFDLTATTSAFDADEIIDWAIVHCNNLNVELRCTKYYCFEELFLSYKELLDLCKEYARVNKILNTYFPVLEYVYNCINTSNEYYDRTNDIIQRFINSVKDAGVNKEHFCAALLLNTSRLLKGGWTIDKGTIGDCWLKEQSDVKVGNKKYFCDNCVSALKGLSARDKLNYLEKNSMCNLHRPFSDFFL